MSEAKSRFKIKNGEVEIEYEGLVSDVNERYGEALDWLKSIPRREGEKKKAEKTEKKEGEEKKRGTRGPEIWSPAIDSLIQEGFFKSPNNRDNKAVIKALKDKALPVKGKARIILQTLTRKVRRGDLKGTRGPEGWTFWTE
jgi:uncharacterized protein YajQ (UPF0234 family)